MLKVGGKFWKLIFFGCQAEFKYRQMKKEKKAEEMEAFNNIKLVRSLYGTAHCLKMEVMKERTMVVEKQTMEKLVEQEEDEPRFYTEEEQLDI